MQELIPIEFLVVLGVTVVALIAFTYYGFNMVFKKSASSFKLPRRSTLAGIWTFLFLGMFIGVFIMMAMYTGALGVGTDFDWLFNNEHVVILVVSLLVALTIPLAYLYIYRGGS